jgi:hypothetical protein
VNREQVNPYGPDGVLGTPDRIRKSRECRCRGTGFLQVMNHGGFVTPTGLPITDKTVCVSCNCTVGVELGIARAKPVPGLPPLDPMAVFDPRTMQLYSDWWREHHPEPQVFTHPRKEPG